jgi:hypothetical protein
MDALVGLDVEVALVRFLELLRRDAYEPRMNIHEPGHELLLCELLVRIEDWRSRARRSSRFLPTRR